MDQQPLLPKSHGQVRYEKHRAGWKALFPGVRLPMATWEQCSPIEQDAWETIAAKERAAELEETS